ncbi:hypothetical protein D1872_262580 [compost metagenome]
MAADVCGYGPPGHRPVRRDYQQRFCHLGKCTAPSVRDTAEHRRFTETNPAFGHSGVADFIGYLDPFRIVLRLASGLWLVRLY